MFLRIPGIRRDSLFIKDGKIVYEKYEGISDLSIAGHQRVFNAANSSAGDGWGTGWDTAKYQTVFGIQRPKQHRHLSF